MESGPNKMGSLKDVSGPRVPRIPSGEKVNKSNVILAP